MFVWETGELEELWELPVDIDRIDRLHAHSLNTWADNSLVYNFYESIATIRMIM
jgi:hypothetical protein